MTSTPPDPEGESKQPDGVNTTAGAWTPEECIVLDIRGDYGHFRRPATSSPAQTFGLPPRTTVAGLLAGMLGMERDSYYDLFSRERSRVAVSLEAPIRRESIGINVLTTDGTNRSGKGATMNRNITKYRQQTSFETLCEPAYRIYVALDDAETMDQMEAMFEAGKSVYTPSLGLSEHLASFEYHGRLPIEQQTGRAEIRSAVPGETISLIPDPGAHYVEERSPAFMASHEGGRKADGSQTLTYDRNAGPIELRDATYAEVGDDAVIFS